MTDATWKAHPHSDDYNTGTNWTGSVVPDGTALFGTSDTTHLIFSQGTTTFSGGWTFKRGAPNYTVHLVDLGASGFNDLVFTGAGIAIKDSIVKIVSGEASRRRPSCFPLS